MRLQAGSENDLGLRTRRYAVNIIRLAETLPHNVAGYKIGEQIIRCGSSVGAQLAEGKRAKSRKDFISKLEGVLQELEETKFWILLIGDVGYIDLSRLSPLLQETDELLAIFVTIVSKTRRHDKGN